MINYEIEPAALISYVPRGTELDTWNGKTFVSMVGFMFLETRVMRLRIPFHSSFEEVNLRFYVKRKTDAGWRRGVVFIKEIVPRRAIAAVARLIYNENYVAMSMRHLIEIGQSNSNRSGVVEYGWLHAGRWNHLRVRTIGEAEPLAAGSEEEFITEHYWGYAAQPSGGAVEYQVEHPPWLVWQVAEPSLDCDAESIYGKRFADALKSKPSSAFLALGSDVIVRRGMPIS